MCEISGFGAPATAACWLPDGETFVVSTLATDYSIGTYSITDSQAVPGGFRESNLRVFDLALSPDMSRLVALTEQQIIVYDYATKHRIGEYPVVDPFAGLDSSVLGSGTPHVNRDGSARQRTRQERHSSTGLVITRDAQGNTIATPSRPQRPSLTSISISADSKYMLVSQNPSWIRMLHIDTGEEVRAFEGHRQEQFMIRSSWGGAHESFVVSGSEGSYLFSGFWQ
jgi:WD40 repeat protein